MSETGGPTAWSKTLNEAHTPQSEDGQEPLLKSLPPGTIVDGRYEIVTVLGRGGCGCVYKVHQMVMNKVLALKTLNPSTSRLTIMRLQKEAQALSRLEHSNIVQAFDFGMLGEDQPFFVMEYVNGPTLAQHLKASGRVSVEAMVELFAPICQALSYAHEKGVVHRDIKPSNIILAANPDDSRKFVPKLVDFGIAKLQFGDDNSATLTRTGDIFGTPLYMSPEQCLGSKVDHRSDIYSLGCVIFQALTGSPPFTGSSPIKTMMEHSSADVPSLNDMAPDIEFPPAIEQIIARMLAKDPSDRYQSFKQVLEELLTLQEGMRDVLTTASQSGHAGDKKGKRPAKLATILAGMALLVVAVGIGVYLIKPFAKSSKSENAIFKHQAKLDKGYASGLRSLNEAEKVMLAEGPSYFSFTKDDELCFKFPTKQLLGKLKFWTTETEKQDITARRTVTVPLDAKLTLFAAEPLLAQPTLWSRFRQKDLYGVRLDFTQAITAEKFDDAVDSFLQISRKQPGTGKRDFKAIMAQAEKEIDPNALQDSNLKAQNLNAVIAFDNLRLLGLLFADFNDRTWLHMGTMPNLRWIWLDACHLNGKKPRGENLVQLSNLNNLRVLSIDKFDAPQAMLSQLTHSRELKRLSLGVVPITKKDLSLIAKIPNLDTLRLRELTLSSDAHLGLLAAAPHLERLALDQVAIQQSALLSELIKLKQLKELVVDYPEKSKEFQAIRVVPGCRVLSIERAHTTWFDWTQENPDVTGLW